MSWPPAEGRPLPDLRGKVAVITGASRGLGAGLAHEAARYGLTLGLCARTRPELPPGARGWCESVDVRRPEQVAAFAARVAERLGPIALWINNAGVLDPIVPVRELEPAALSDHLAVNLLGPLAGTQAYLRHLRARGGEGVLINVSSGAAQRGYAGWAAYCAGKAALDRLTEVVQLEEAERGLRAWALAPGIVETAMQERVRACDPAVFPLVERFQRLHESGAMNSPAWVARHVLALAFDPECRPEGVVVRVPDEHPALP